MIFFASRKRSKMVKEWIFLKTISLGHVIDLIASDRVFFPVNMLLPGNEFLYGVVRE